MASHLQPGGNPPQTGPPYYPTTWSLGGVAERIPDIPVSSVFLVLFLVSAAVHMTILQLNQRRGHKFLFSGLLFGFSMARIVSMILRIASICKPYNINLAIAAQVFLSAGVVIIFIVNLVFTQRLMRSAHPNSGWHPFFSMAFTALYALIIISIIMLITCVVQMFFTLNHNTRRIDRDIQLYGVTLFAIVAFLPIPIVIIGLLIPRSKGTRLDKFGHGRFREKVAILLTSATLIAFGAAYRAGAAWHTPVQRTQPMPASFNKAALYITYFTVEIIVLLLYAIVRVDLRFHVPNGAHGPGSYSNNAKLHDATTEKNADEEAAAETAPRTAPKPLEHRVFTEEETLDNDPRLDMEQSNAGNGDVNAGATRWDARPAV